MGWRRSGAAGVVLMGIALALPANAAEGLTGDWGGLRSRLAERGVDPFAVYVAGVWANASGGLRTGARYEGFARFGLKADLEELCGWSGARFQIGWNSYHGGQPADDLVGTLGATSPSLWESENHFRFFEIYLEQAFADGRVLAKLGQLSADEDFYSDPRHSDRMLNAVFTFLALGRDRELGPFYPLAAPGAVVSWRPDDTWDLRLGAYVSDVGEDESSNVGFDWSFDEGALLTAELSAQVEPGGRPGRYALGALGVTQDIPRFDDPGGGLATGGYGFYATGDQSFWVRDGRSLIGGFLALQYIPQEDRATVRWGFDAGLKLHGIGPIRAEDSLSVGVSFVSMGRDFVRFQDARGQPISKTQWGFELTYHAQLTPWLSVQPNLQLFFDPILAGDDAVVLGLQVRLDL